MSIEVKVTYLPNGDRSRSEEIAKLTISNISELAELSDYEFVFDTKPFDFINRAAEIVHGRYVGHFRRDGVWALIRKILVQSEHRL